MNIYRASSEGKSNHSVFRGTTVFKMRLTSLRIASQSVGAGLAVKRLSFRHATSGVQCLRIAAQGGK